MAHELANIYILWISRLRWLTKGCTYEGNHVLAIFKEPENYESLKNALADIIEEVESLTNVDINGTTYNIEYFIGGDWKFFALITGKCWP